MSSIEIAFERNFDTLLIDSIEFMFDALDMHPVEDRGHTLSRASIVFSLLMLESAANTCIDHLNLESSVQNEIDRLPLVGKFDFYLRTNFRNRKLDRGVKQIEWLRELKQIRDRLVHPKYHKVEWVKHSEDGASAFAVKTKVLDVAINPKFWNGEEALKVTKAVHGFLHYFFKDKCKHSSRMVSSLLFSESSVPGDDNHFLPCFYRVTKKRLESNGIDLSYLKLAWA